MKLVDQHGVAAGRPVLSMLAQFGRAYALRSIMSSVQSRYVGISVKTDPVLSESSSTPYPSGNTGFPKLARLRKVG